jgi:hypothetical protein
MGFIYATEKGAQGDPLLFANFLFDFSGEKVFSKECAKIEASF